MITRNHMPLRRLTIEVPGDLLVREGVVPAAFFAHNESVEILHVYSFQPRERVLLVRVVRSGPRRTVEQIMRSRGRLRRRYRLRDFEILRVEDGGRIYVALLRQRNPGALEGFLDPLLPRRRRRRAPRLRVVGRARGRVAAAGPPGNPPSGDSRGRGTHGPPARGPEPCLDARILRHPSEGRPRQTGGADRLEPEHREPASPTRPPADPARVAPLRIAGGPVSRPAQPAALSSPKIRRYSRRYRVIRKCRRTCSRPALPIALRRVGSRSSWIVRSAASFTLETRYPCRPSWIWRRMPPTFPPTTGTRFQRDSLTIRPNPSRSDFARETSVSRCRTFTSRAPTPRRSVRKWMSGSSPAWRADCSNTSQPSGSSRAIDAIISSWTFGIFFLTRRYASITPSGSFHGSNRPTWLMTGRSKSTSNRDKIVSRSSSYTWRFFGLTGSIAGGFT